MILKKIVLHNFRNFASREFAFHPFLTIILGENARGKTNLLESAYCLTHGSGFRESKEEELVMIGEERAKIEAEFSSDKQNLNLQIIFNKTKSGLEKKYLINKSHQKLSPFLYEGTKSILFSPQQLEIISGPPDERRQYLDKNISFYDPVYKKRLNNYLNALRKRNKILETYHAEKNLVEELFFWDDYLEEQAAYISLKRKEYVQFLNSNKKLDSKTFSMLYESNLFTKERLKGVFEIEKRYRKTIIGPQKDDFQIFLDDKNIHHYGSRSEHRLGIFWLKVNEIKYYEDTIHKKPVILLDDVFSELDMKNKKLILSLIKKYQTILTTAEPETAELTSLSKALIQI